MAGQERDGMVEALHIIGPGSECMIPSPVGEPAVVVHMHVGSDDQPWNLEIPR
jgi:hypothetical protein